MEIVWYGLSCFRITERGMATVVTDPYNHSAVGYDPLKLKAEIVTASHEAPGHSFVSAVKGASRVITGPGEFEIGVFSSPASRPMARASMTLPSRATRYMSSITMVSALLILAT
jgi:hypothetical protein